MVIIVMGAAGSGKTTVATRLADRLGWPFLEGDDLHPAANVAKMARGEPLTDDDRQPWLEALRARVAGAVAANRNLVVTCSALKERYREILRGDSAGQVRFAYIKITRALLAERLRRRQGHFMKESMLDSQLAALEEPSPADALIVDAGAGDTPDALAGRIIAALSPDLAPGDRDR